MKTVEILGANRFETYTKTRKGCRAVIVQEGKILLTHELNSGWWLMPGGGQEEGETPEDCVVREVEEETGYLVRPVRRFLFTVPGIHPVSDMIGGLLFPSNSWLKSPPTIT